MIHNLKLLFIPFLVGGFVLLLSPGRASASLIFVTDIEVTGTGLGAVNTLVTVNDNGGNSNGTESGCITQGGAFSPCLGGVEGGDNLAINQVLSFDTEENFAAVVNISETGQDLSVTLTDLYLTFSGVGGTHTAFYTGPNLVLTQGTGTGLGGSGFTFRLDAAQLATVQALGNMVTVSGGVQFAENTTNDGNETVHVLQIEDQFGDVPEPSTLFLLGTGTLCLALGGRRKSLFARDKR